MRSADVATVLDLAGRAPMDSGRMGRVVRSCWGRLPLATGPGLLRPPKVAKLFARLGPQRTSLPGVRPANPAQGYQTGGEVFSPCRVGSRVMAMPTCADCVFFVRIRWRRTAVDGSRSQGVRTECRRYPPAYRVTEFRNPVDMRYSGGGGQIPGFITTELGWPETEKHDWCGEHVARAPEEPQRQIGFSSAAHDVSASAE